MWERASSLLCLLLNAGISPLLQESQAQATVDALRSRLALLASVRRDGKWQTLPAAGLVTNDIVKLSLGTVVPADADLIDGSVLLDQSMLTGESVATESGAGAHAFAGALVRRGEALAKVVATGERTKFGRTAELVRTAAAESSQQKTVLRVVRNLVLFNGAVTVLLGVYSFSLSMPIGEMVPLLLVAILSSIPVALPSMFTLAAAVGARSLASRGVLSTRLSAVDEAAGIDVLCSDKTGTLTLNELAVMSASARCLHSTKPTFRWRCRRACELRRWPGCCRRGHSRRLLRQADPGPARVGQVRAVRSGLEALRGHAARRERRAGARCKGGL